MNNKTNKHETVGEALRDIAHHEHAFALADNSTNHMGDLVIYGLTYLFLILLPTDIFEVGWLFILATLVAAISLVRFQNFLKHKIASGKMTSFWVNASLLSTGIRSFVVVNAPLTFFDISMNSSASMFFSLIIGLITGFGGIALQYHYLVRNKVIDKQKESRRQTAKNLGNYISEAAKKSYADRFYFLDLVCGYVICLNYYSYYSINVTSYKVWQFGFTTVIVLLGTWLFQKFLRYRINKSEISKSFKVVFFINDRSTWLLVSHSSLD
ncbi:hypothetical protein [Lactobacillus sp. M0390]|uniref:hypothetical protein n=1 Tax=Lactobacillus sp. M0390 TaxID=2751026 RepID=UPI0018DDF852|nr:hypothetical protein [Lactobacillus sp. M0390]MBH9985516.1 hypothetical protein [Lactobacillus sp. M0390]